MPLSFLVVWCRVTHHNRLQVGNVGLTPDEQRSHFKLWCIAGAPLLAGTDIVHASNETLAILTAPEIIAVNQDLGFQRKIQGKFLGAAAVAVATPTAAPVDTTAAAAGDSKVIVDTCSDASGDQSWELIGASTGMAMASTTASTPPPPYDQLVQIRQKSSGNLLTVPNCEHAVIPHGLEPEGLTVAPAHAGNNTGQCGGKDQLFQFHKNGTITTAVDGACFNVIGSVRENAGVQTYDCTHMGNSPNGQFSLVRPDTWSSHIQAGTSQTSKLCMSTGQPSPRPGPGPAPPPSPPVGSGSEVWAKYLGDGKRVAVLLLNLDDSKAMDLTVSWAQLNLTNPGGEHAVCDLEARQALGDYALNYTAKAVPVHGSVMLSVTM